MQRIVFDSDSLPDGLSEEKRRAVWRDLYADLYATPDVHFLGDRPFRANFVFTSFGDVTVGQCDGTINRVKRTDRDAANDAAGMCYLAVNRSPTRLAYRSMQRDITLGDGDMTLITAGNAIYDIYAIHT